MLFNYKYVTRHPIDVGVQNNSLIKINSTFSQDVNNIEFYSSSPGLEEAAIDYSFPELVDVDSVDFSFSESVEVETTVGSDTTLPEHVEVETESLTTQSLSSDASTDSSFPDLVDVPNAFDILDISVYENYLLDPSNHIIDIFINGKAIIAIETINDVLTVEPGMVISSILAVLL